MNNLRYLLSNVSILNQHHWVVNDISKQNKNQAVKFGLDLCSSFRADPSGYLQALSPSKISIINFLIYLTYKNEKVWPTQTTVANFVGIGREHCNRLIKELSEDGIIRKKYRHMTSCLYKIADVFTRPEARSRMGNLLHALKALSLRVVTQYNLGYFEYNKLSQTTKNIVSLEGRRGGMNPISENIRGLKLLPLSRWGQIKLSAFPDSAILYAAAKLPYFKDIRNPFNCFFKLCLDYCNDNQIKPDWEWSKQLAIQYKMPDNAAMLRDENVEVKKESQKRGIPTVRTYSKPRIGIPEAPLTTEQAAQKVRAFNDSLNNPSVQRFMALVGKDVVCGYVDALTKRIEKRVVKIA